MFKSLTVVLSLLCCIPNVVLAQNNSLGLGIILGEPTGISIKLWLSEKSAVDGSIAWSLIENSHLHLHGDYLWHNYDITGVRKGKLPIYYGIGARIRFDHKPEHVVHGRIHSSKDETRFGMRGVLGLEYLFTTAPFDLFFEFAPIMDLIPGSDFSLNAALGFRYFF